MLQNKYKKTMKNLNLFLWIFTTAVASYFAYHTYTHTRIRYKDLESVMMQNLAVEKGIEATRQNTEKHLKESIEGIEKQGNTPKDVIIGNRIKYIYEITDSTLNVLDNMINDGETSKLNNKISISNENLVFIYSSGSDMPKIIAQIDTFKRDLCVTIIPNIDNKSHFYPFSKQAMLNYKNSFARLQNQGTLITNMCMMTIKFDRIFAMASQKSWVLNVGDIYEAKMFMRTTELEATRYFMQYRMKVSEGIVNVRKDVGEIEIKNVKAQNYNSEGKSTKTLTGKITIKKADGSDTTFTLSTSYTVKKK
jgi:hypothetical protein